MVKKGCYDMKEGILFLYLERQFRELPQVVPGGQLWVENGDRAPGQLPLSVVEGQWHRRHLNSIKLTISVSEFLPVCLCCRPCSSDGMCASGSRCNGKASGYLNKMKWTQKKTTSSIGAKEVVGHVGVEVEVVCVVQEVPSQWP